MTAEKSWEMLMQNDLPVIMIMIVETGVEGMGSSFIYMTRVMRK